MKMVTDYSYDNIRNCHEGLIAVCKNKKWGYLNKYGEEIIKLRFDTVYDFQEGLAPVVIDDKWGFIDQEGNILR